MLCLSGFEDFLKNILVGCHWEHGLEHNITNIATFSL